MVWDADLLKADLECSGKELRGKTVDIREGGGEGRHFPLFQKNQLFNDN